MSSSSNNDSDNAGPTLLTISIVMITLCLITTSMRLTVRYNRHALGSDDYTITTATLLALGRIIVQIISVPHGNGRHRDTISVSNYQYVNFLTWLTQLFLFPILCLLKISVCLLVLRIKNTRPLRLGLWTLIAALVLTTLLPEIVLLAECSPVSAYWTSQADKCWTPDVRIYSIYLQTAVSVLADIICTLLPIAVVWNLTLSARNKFAVCALMSLGVVSTSFACVRASSLGTAVQDLSWTYCWAAIWGDIELGFGILGANLALSRTYFDYFCKGLSNITSYTRSRSHPSRAGYAANPSSKNSYPLSSNSNSHHNNNNKVLSASTTATTTTAAGGAYDGSHAAGKSAVNVGVRGGVGRESWDGSQGSDEVPLHPMYGGEGQGGALGGIRREVEFRVWDEEEGRGVGIGRGL